jgi:hypothetical protein
VASKSAGSDYVDVPGKATVAITAAAIGDSSNLVSGTEFTIASFGKDSYVAKNDVPLTGGSSEEVQVVSKDDQKNLATSLSQELLTSLTTKANGGTVPGVGVYLIPDSSVVDSVSYSAKVGESAKSLSANMTLKVSLLKYKTDDVETLVNSSIDQAIPPGYIRSNIPSTVDLSASSASSTENSVKGHAKVKVFLLPVIDQSSLAKSLKGKPATSLGPILSSVVPGYVGAEVEILPKYLPTRFKSLPLNGSHITIRLSSSL